MEEVDYGRRLDAYALLTGPRWAEMGSPQAGPLLAQCLNDLRNPEDMALRHGASQALRGLVEGAALVEAREVEAGGDPWGEGDHLITHVLLRTALPALKQSMASSSLAVRQVSFHACHLHAVTFRVAEGQLT